jgi:hypothetical protein
VGSLAAAGILAFSGSCYAVALTEDRSKAKLAPFGRVCRCPLPQWCRRRWRMFSHPDLPCVCRGMALIAAWLALAL